MIVNRKHLLLIAPLLACLTLEPAVIAQKSTDTPVTTTVKDADANIATALQIRSDGAGAYTNTKYVQSVIQPIGDWVMNSNFSSLSTRTVFVDFGQTVAGSCSSCPNGNPIALASKLYHTRFITKCAEYNNSFLTLPLGATMPCPMYTRVDVHGQNYRINMNPVSSAQAYYPETNYVSVTCTGANSTGQCNRWTVTPSGSYVRADGTTARGNIGKLVKVTTVKGKTVDVDQGDFYFSFSIE